MILVRVLFLGPAKDFARAESASVSLPPGATVADLRGRLIGEFRGLREPMPTIRFAVNGEFAGDEVPLHDGDEAALLPPVSGGSNPADLLVELTSGPIHLRRVAEFVHGRPDAGGIVTFEGVVRAETDPQHGSLVRLEYEAHETMARCQLLRLAEQVRLRWSAGRVAILHRRGAVPLGEVSVVIAVACGHRAEAFEACRWIIEILKKDVAIWKKDVFEDGHCRWVGGDAPRDERWKVACSVTGGDPRDRAGTEH